MDGQLTLTRSDGTATVLYNSDGSVTVTSSNGETRTFTREELDTAARDCVPDVDRPQT